MTRLTMDEYGLALADVVKQRAACTRRQVGAVIIGPDKRVVATGYNGVPAGEQHCTEGGCPRGRFTPDEVPGFSQGNNDYVTGNMRCPAIHAERNAIDWMLMVVPRESDYSDHTIYISCPPCAHCETLAVQYGLRMVWPW